MARGFDPSTFVVLGEGLAAGVGHFSLSADVQEFSFPSLIAQQLSTTLRQPILQPPGIGNIGFQHLPTLTPDLLQTTVVEGLEGGTSFDNLSIPGLRLEEAFERRPAAPMVRRDDPKQTLVNVVLGMPELTRVPGGKLPTQLEAAQTRKPTFALVCLGYQELLEPLVAGHLHDAAPADLAGFGKRYQKLLGSLKGRRTTLLVVNAPNPLDTAYFSSIETAAHILRTEPSFLRRRYGLAESDLITLEGLYQLGFEFTARELSGSLAPEMVLSAERAESVRRAVAKLNDEIRAAAAENDALFFDLEAFLRGVALDGAKVGRRKLTADYLGGFYLLNGAFPGRTGHALIADAILDLLGEHFDNLALSKVDVEAILADDGNALSKVADGPTFTEEYLQPRTDDDLPGLPPPDPSLINIPPPFDPMKVNLFPIQTTYPYPPFDIGGVKAAAGVEPAVGMPAGGISDPSLSESFRPLELPPGLEQTLDLNPAESYFGDALRACDAPDEKPFLPGIPTFGASGNTFFGGMAMTDSHLSGKVRIRFSEPDERGISRFEISHPGGLKGEDGVLAAPKMFRMAAQLNRVIDLPGLISGGELDLNTGRVTNLRYIVAFLNSQILTLFGVNPNLPMGPLVFPGPPNGGSTWARFDQRPDGKLDFSFAGNLWLPLGIEHGGEPVRFPLPFGNPKLQCASVVARGTSLHPHIHLSTKESVSETFESEAPDIPVNTIREYTAFTHNTSFGDVFGLEIDELGGAGTGRCHLLGRIRVQFGPRFGDSVPVSFGFLPPGGQLDPEPVPLPYLPPGTPRGMIGFNEQLKFPSGVTYNQSGLSCAMDPMNLPFSAIDLKTGRLRDELLFRGFVVQKLFVNLIRIEPGTPGDSFNYQGPARFSRGPNGETVFSFNGEVFIPYPKGFRFPGPTPDGEPPFTVQRPSRLDPFLRIQAISGGEPFHGVLQGGTARKPIKQTSSIGQEFSYHYSIPCDPAKADDAVFKYVNETDGHGGGTFVLQRLTWLDTGNTRRSQAGPGEVDILTFTGFGAWTPKDGDGDDRLHLVSVQISTSETEPYVAIQVDGSTTSNVNTKPADIEQTIPLLGEH